MLTYDDMVTYDDRMTYDDMSVRLHKDESREMLYVCTSGVSKTKR